MDLSDVDGGRIPQIMGSGAKSMMAAIKRRERAKYKFDDAFFKRIKLTCYAPSDWEVTTDMRRKREPLS